MSCSRNVREMNVGEKVGFWFMWLGKLVTGHLARTCLASLRRLFTVAALV